MGPNKSYAAPKDILENRSLMPEYQIIYQGVTLSPLWRPKAVLFPAAWGAIVSKVFDLIRKVLFTIAFVEDQRPPIKFNASL